jgi:hypothetical protein
MIHSPSFERSAFAANHPLESILNRREIQPLGVTLVAADFLPMNIMQTLYEKLSAQRFGNRSHGQAQSCHPLLFAFNLSTVSDAHFYKFAGLESRQVQFKLQSACWGCGWESIFNSSVIPSSAN